MDIREVHNCLSLTVNLSSSLTAVSIGTHYTLNLHVYATRT